MSVLGRPGPARAAFSLAFFKNANFGLVWAGPVGTAQASPGRPKQDAFLHGFFLFLLFSCYSLLLFFSVFSASSPVATVASHDFSLKHQERNNGRSTDNVRPDWGFDRSNVRFAGHVVRSHSIILK